MSRWLTRILFGVFVLSVGAVIAKAAMPHGIASQGPTIAESGFAGENLRAMDKMMADMTIAPSGNVDRDFVAMMVPHHQGAIEMALAELRYGKDSTLRRMAQGIIVEQQQEIDAMRLASSKLNSTMPQGPTILNICRSRI